MLSLGLVAAALVAFCLVVWLAVKQLQGLGRRRQWNVEAATEWGVPLACKIDDRRRVFVEGDHVGTIAGSRFVTATGMTISGNGDSTAILHGATISVAQSRRTIRLKFLEARAESAPPEQHYVQRKR